MPTQAEKPTRKTRWSSNVLNYTMSSITEV
jgi:hypothetical protein